MLCFGTPIPLQSSLLLTGAGPGSGASFAGPLDAFTADLAGAWLPFRGFTDYAGAGWTVRDTDDDAEQDVLFDAAGEPIFPTVVGDAAIASWKSQAPAANAAAQATDSAQPLLIDAVVGGYPVARFNGTSHTLSLTCAKDEGLTVYLVAKKVTTSNGANARLLSLERGVNCDTFYEPGSDVWRYFSTSPNVVDTVCSDATNWNLLTHHYESDDCKAYQNNTLVVTFGKELLNSSTTVDLCSLGGLSFFCQADIAALLIYTTAHNDTTRQAIQTILANKFGITLA
jgi:hypothetical protein